MPRRTRALLAILGGLLLIFALAALVYAALPAPVESGIYPVSPLLLIPPGGAP
jgi:hypothetical protein